MRTIQTLLMWGALAGLSVLLPVLVALWCKERQLFPGRRLLVAYRRLPWFGQFLILAFAVHLIIFGSTKTNATDGVSGGASASQRLGVRQPSEATQPKAARRELLVPTVSVDDIVRGYRLAEVTTNATISYEMPGDAILCGNWHLRGAYDDVTRIDLEDWRFPLGSNSCDHLWSFVSAALRPTIRDAQHALVATDETLSAIPRQSALWLSADSPLVRRITWEDFALGRVPISTTDDETNAMELVSAQIELHRNGDFITRANDVEKIYRRVNPFDWDGDGLPNDRDPNPYVYDGDHFGQGEGWVRTHFDDPTDVLALGYANWIDAQVGYGETNGLYKFTASFPVAPPESTLLRVGEESVVVTNAGEYVFLLEKGREYEFETIPYDPTVEYWMQDDLADCPVFANWWWEDDVATWTEDGGTPEIRHQTRDEKGRCLWMPLFRGSPDVSHIGPDDALEFVALFEDYCHEDGVSYNWYCEDSNVVIESPHSRVTTVRFEEMPNWRSASLSVEATIGAYVLRSALATFSYGTNSVPEPASVSVSFDKNAIVYEKAYTESNGQEVPHRSTSSVLHCFARGGTNGGLVTFGIAEGDDRVQQVSGESLPFSRRLRAGEEISFEVVLTANEATAEAGRVSVYGCLDQSVTSIEAHASLTVAEVETRVDCNWISSVHRKRLGVGEEMRISVHPIDDDIAVSVSGCTHMNDMWLYKAGSRKLDDLISICIDDVDFVIPVKVVEPECIDVVWYAAETNAAVGAAGGIVGFYSLVIQPTNVSFEAVTTAELPSVSTNAWGYFAQEQYSYLLDHGLHGAGKWHGVNFENSFSDIVGVSVLPPPWLDGGSFTWPIQNAWKMRSDPSTTNQFNHVSGYDQTFVLGGDGTTTIEKFGCSAQRGTNGVLTVTRSLK